MDKDEVAAETSGSPKPSSDPADPADPADPTTPKKRRVESSSSSEFDSDQSEFVFESTEYETESESGSLDDEQPSTSGFIPTGNQPVSDTDSDEEFQFSCNPDSDLESEPKSESEPESDSLPIPVDDEQPSTSGSIPTGNEPESQEPESQEPESQEPETVQQPKSEPESDSLPIPVDDEQPSTSGSIPTGNEPKSQVPETVQQALERLTKMADNISRRVRERNLERDETRAPIIAEIRAARKRRMRSEAYLRANLRPLGPPNSHILVVDPNNRMAQLNEEVQNLLQRVQQLRDQLPGPEQMPQQVAYLAPRHPWPVPYRPLLLTHPVGQPWRFPRPPRAPRSPQTPPQAVRDRQPETPPDTPPYSVRNYLPGSPPELVRNPLHIPLAPSPERDLVRNPLQPRLPQVPPQPVRNPVRRPLDRRFPRMPFCYGQDRFPTRNPYRRLPQPPPPPKPKENQLTEELRQRAEEILNGPPNDIIANKFKMTIRRHDVKFHLASGCLLHDQIIDFYFNMIAERSEQRAKGLPSVYAFSSFFMPRLLEGGYQAVRRWTRKVNIFSKDLLLFPHIYGKDLWCLAIVDFRKKAIRYYDSTKKSKPATALAALKSYVKEESMDKRNQELDMSGYYSGAVRALPQQTNLNDAGVFCAMYAEHLSRNAEIVFTQGDMEYFRVKMLLEIANGKLQEDESGG